MHSDRIYKTDTRGSNGGLTEYFSLISLQRTTHLGYSVTPPTGLGQTHGMGLRYKKQTFCNIRSLLFLLFFFHLSYLITWGSSFTLLSILSACFSLTISLTHSYHVWVYLMHSGLFGNLSIFGLIGIQLVYSIVIIYSGTYPFGFYLSLSLTDDMKLTCWCILSLVTLQLPLHQTSPLARLHTHMLHWHCALFPLSTNMRGTCFSLCRLSTLTPLALLYTSALISDRTPANGTCQSCIALGCFGGLVFCQVCSRSVKVWQLL